MAQAVIGALRVTLGMDSAAFSKGVKDANTKMAKFGKAAAKGMAVVGAASAAAAGAVSLAVRGVLNDADAMAKSSRKIGVPVDELSRLRHAADLSGVSMGGLENGLKRLSANMYDASKGIGEGAQAFKDLGIDVTNADGSLKSSTQVMTEMAAKFAEMPDGAQKTALAMRLMGKSGADMIPMLNGGADALQSMIEEADKLGIVITPDMAANAEQFNDNLTRLGGAVKGLAVQLTAALAPTLASITDGIVKAVNGFKLLSPGTQKFIGIAAALTAGLTALAIPLGALVIAFGAISAPVLAAVAAIAAITAGVVAFWPEIQKLWEGLKGLPAAIVEAFRELPATMTTIGSDIIAGLWQGIQNKWEEVKSGVTNIASGIKDKFVNFFQIKSPSRVMMGVGQDITAGLAVGMENGADGVLDVADRLGAGIAGAFKGIGDGISAAIQGTRSWASVAMDAIKSVARAALNAWEPTTQGGGFMKELLGGLVGALPSANGGGFTGSGPRTGGIDGKGGFLAINHPDETIIDHKKSGMMAGKGVQVSVVSRFDADGNFQTVVEEISSGTVQRTAPAIVGASEAKVGQNIANGTYDKPFNRYGTQPQARNMG